MSPAKRAAGMLAAVAAIGVCARRRSPRPIRSSTLLSRSSTISKSARSQGCRAAGPTYRTTDEFNAELTALADDLPDPGRRQGRALQEHPGPRRSSTSRSPTTRPRSATASPCSSTWARSTATRRAAAEDSLEFAYDVLLQAKTNPKVAALLDKVRLIDLPLDQPRRPRVQERHHGRRRPAPRELRSGRRDRPARHVRRPPGVDLNRNYPFGWGSNIGVTLDRARLRPGLRARGQEHDGHRASSNQVVTLRDPAHELARDLLPGPGDLRRPDAGPQQRLPRPRAGDGPRDRRRLHQRPRLRARLRDQRRDDRLVLLRDPRHRQHARARRLPAPAARRRSRPTSNAPRADYTGTAGPGSTAAQTARFQGHPVRNAIWLDLVYASLAAAHSQITGTAVPGATLKITKDFNLYTAPVQIGNTVGGDRPVDAAAGDPDAPRVLADGPGLRQVHVGRQPVRPSRPGLRGRRRARRPARLLRRELHAHLHRRRRHAARHDQGHSSTRATSPTSRRARTGGVGGSVPATLVADARRARPGSARSRRASPRTTPRPRRPT